MVFYNCAQMYQEALKVGFKYLCFFVCFVFCFAFTHTLSLSDLHIFLDLFKILLFFFITKRVTPCNIFDNDVKPP